MGEVVEVGSENKALKVGDRAVVPFTISCGECFFCKRGFLLRLRAQQPEPCDGREDMGRFSSWVFRLFAYARRL
jgi:threonine dehydrogenase-like Zn-dependent dehydrogenase